MNSFGSQKITKQKDIILGYTITFIRIYSQITK